MILAIVANAYICLIFMVVTGIRQGSKWRKNFFQFLQVMCWCQRFSSVPQFFIFYFGIFLCLMKCNIKSIVSPSRFLLLYLAGRKASILCFQQLVEIHWKYLHFLFLRSCFKSYQMNKCVQTLFAIIIKLSSNKFLAIDLNIVSNDLIYLLTSHLGCTSVFVYPQIKFKTDFY